MATKYRNTAIAALAAVALVAVIWLYQGLRTSHFELGTNEAIDETPTQIERIRDIGEWEFLTINNEELVDTVRKGLLSNDQLVRIYYGTLRLGINMNQVKSGWAQQYNDTLTMTLPKIGLLDEDFIDEARTKPFFETGSWKAEAREALYKKAYRQMKAHCLTPANLQMAQNNADAQFRQMLRSMGYNHVIIKFEK